MTDLYPGLAETDFNQQDQTTYPDPLPPETVRALLGPTEHEHQAEAI